MLKKQRWTRPYSQKREGYENLQNLAIETSFKYLFLSVLENGKETVLAIAICIWKEEDDHKFQASQKNAPVSMNCQSKTVATLTQGNIYNCNGYCNAEEDNATNTCTFVVVTKQSKSLWSKVVTIILKRLFQKVQILTETILFQVNKTI